MTLSCLCRKVPSRDRHTRKFAVSPLSALRHDNGDRCINVDAVADAAWFATCEDMKPLGVSPDSSGASVSGDGTASGL